MEYSKQYYINMVTSFAALAVCGTLNVIRSIYNINYIGIAIALSYLTFSIVVLSKLYNQYKVYKINSFNGSEKTEEIYLPLCKRSKSCLGFAFGFILSQAIFWNL